MAHIFRTFEENQGSRFVSITFRRYALNSLARLAILLCGGDKSSRLTVAYILQCIASVRPSNRANKISYNLEPGQEHYNQAQIQHKLWVSHCLRSSNSQTR